MSNQSARELVIEAEEKLREAKKLLTEEESKLTPVDLSWLVNSNVPVLVRDNRAVPWKKRFLIKIRDTSYIYWDGVAGWLKAKPDPDHWVFHDGKSECPIPEGFAYETQLIGDYDKPVLEMMTGGNPNRVCWLHKGIYKKVVSYRITGLKDGYCYPWDK